VKPQINKSLWRGQVEEYRHHLAQVRRKSAALLAETALNQTQAVLLGQMLGAVNEVDHAVARLLAIAEESAEMVSGAEANDTPPLRKVK
jgi:hypothetical protein